MDQADIERVSKALSDQTRLMIFQAIAEKRCISCGDIASLQGVTPATVSHHLKTLADAGLIECRREGQFVHCVAVPATLDEYTRSRRRIARRTQKPECVESLPASLVANRSAKSIQGGYTSIH
jgi:ArsR family transcriptional regulator, arsenate/arsenite/antimonite-responsive transcriptional repressor